MIYSSSLNIPVKKAFGKQAMQSTLNKICSQLILDPDTTDMDVVILGPKDATGPRREQVQQAINERHPDICVIYVYEKDKDADLLECEYTKQVRKVKDASLREVFEEFVGQHKVRQGKNVVKSADFVVPDSDQIGAVEGDDEEEIGYVEREQTDYAAIGERPEGEEEIVMNDPLADLPPIDTSEFTEQETQDIDTDDSVDNPLSASDMELPDYPKVEDPLTQRLDALNVFEDWSLFKERLTKDSVIKELIHENTEYVGLVQMLEVLDKEIETIWRDPVLSSDQKFEKIKEIGLRRSVVRATTNSINVEKVVNIISTIVLSAKRTVEDKINSIDVALYRISTDKKNIMDTSNVDRAIAERTQVQLDLLEMVRTVIDLYKTVDNFVVDEIAELDRHLPSANQFINDMVAPIGNQIFTPVNTATLANKLMQALQQNRLLASQLEESLNGIIEKMFELCEKDEEIIRYQQNMINLLRANRVEDVIIVDTLLKKSLRLWVGADNTGRSATAITYCGCLSRRQNCLLIDLTGRAKFKDYGIEPVPLNEFMTHRIEQQFVCVESDSILAPEEIQELVQQLNSRLNYYPFVNIILAPEDEQGLDQLSKDALCVHYITDCTPVSMRVIKNIVSRHKNENIARKLVTIDTPVSPLMVADNVGIDPTLCKLVTLPSVPAIRACALKHDRPYEYNDVVKLFEESFR